MGKKKNQNDVLGIYSDVSFIVRVIKKWKLVILGLMLAAGVFSYIFMDLRLNETYSVSAIVSVVSKQSSEYSINDSNINGAVARNIAMWQSNALRKAIMDNHPDHPIRGYLSARNLEDTALIELNVSADTAEEAYYYLNEALKHKREIEANFDEAYVAKEVVGLNANSISHYRSNPVKYAVAAIVLVLMGCLGVLILWSLLTTVIHNDSQAHKLVDAPILESIPNIKKKSKSILISQNDIDTSYARHIDRLAARVEQELRRKGHKTLLVTSIRENEGKSTITTNLALDLARRGNRTLLIDLDLRRPALFKIFDHEKKPGYSFSDFLKDRVELRDVMEQLDDIYALWQYSSVRDSDRFLEKVDLDNVLKNLKPYYDVILLDTPPLGPVRDTDVIASHVKYSLFVVRQDYTRAGEINDAIDSMEEHGNHCMGIVLNNCKGTDWGMTRTGRRYYRKYVKSKKGGIA